MKTNGKGHVKRIGKTVIILVPVLIAGTFRELGIRSEDAGESVAQLGANGNLDGGEDQGKAHTALESVVPAYVGVVEGVAVLLFHKW